MSQLTREQMEQLAELARLGFDAAAIERFRTQAGAILAFVEQLNEVDTTGVPPMAELRTTGTPLREDVSRPSTQAEAIQANAPQHDGAFFTVPKVIG